MARRQGWIKVGDGEAVGTWPIAALVIVRLAQAATWAAIAHAAPDSIPWIWDQIEASSSAISSAVRSNRP